MFKKLISLLILLSFSSSALLAQIPGNLNSLAGKQLLKLEQGKETIMPLIETGLAEQPKLANEPVIEPVSEIESALSKSLSLDNGAVLTQYGYDVFKSTVASFTPPADVPVGPDYIIGPGDSFNITLWGITEGIFKAEVNREGAIVLPKVGVVKVVGLSYGELKPFVEQQLGKYYESVNVGITIDTLRTIRVYVVGEVVQPGSYAISSLSTVYTALFAAGGPTKRGTLRNIQLIRNSRQIANLDLYKFLLKGDKSQDQPLQSGDTIFVSLIGPVAGISGGVYRPAIYELKGATDLGEFIALAGGFLPTGYLNRVQVERVVAHEKRIVRDENVSRARPGEKLGLTVANMDFIKVAPIYEGVSNIVYLDGEVKYPGGYEFKPGMKIKDLLPNYAAFTSVSNLDYLEVSRLDQATQQITIVPLNYQKLWAGDDSQNIQLQPLDHLRVFAKTKIQGLVTIKGEVLRPGEFAIRKGERLSSVLQRAGGFTSDAFLFGAKLIRPSARAAQQVRLKQLVERLRYQILQRSREIIGGALGPAAIALKNAELDKAKDALEFLGGQVQEGRVIFHLSADLAKFGGTVDDLELEAGDEISIPKVAGTVNVLGEVYNPTTVVYQPKKNLSFYLNLVGGATKIADLSSIYLVRADGTVLSRDQNINLAAVELFPGDSILVPERIETFNIFVAFKDWTHWLYEASIGFAVIATYLKK